MSPKFAPEICHVRGSNPDRLGLFQPAKAKQKSPELHLIFPHSLPLQPVIRARHRFYLVSCGAKSLSTTLSFVPSPGIFAVYSFTTPPQTRKRKAAEAAITDKDEPLPKAAHGSRNATLAFSDRRRPRHESTTEIETTDIISTASFNGQVDRPSATSASTAASMDSDDECMSDVSSQEDFPDTEGSDDESLGEGMCSLDLGSCVLDICVAFLCMVSVTNKMFLPCE
jgi:hypothetical protein